MSQASGGIAGFVRGVFLENVGLKFLSLVLAIGFYVFIRGGAEAKRVEERAQRRLAVPVVAVVPPDEARRKLIDPPPTVVSVTVSGPKSQIDQLDTSALGTLQLDLQTGYETTVEMKPELFTPPPGLTVEEIFPAQIDVRWDDVITRKIPVELKRGRDAKTGFALVGPIVVKPDTIEATGPRRIVDTIPNAATTLFEIGEFEEGSHTASVDLLAPPSQVSFSADQVVATLDIVREEHTVTFDAVPVEVIGLPNATVKPKTVKVKAKGQRDVVNALQAGSLVPRVELPSDVDVKKPGSRYLDVELTITDVTVQLDPPKVLVKW